MNKIDINDLFFDIYQENLDKIKLYPKEIINTIYDNHTPLTFAIHNNRPKALKMLLELGADVNLSASLGFTPLMLSGSIELTSFLLEYKPKLNLQNKDGNTATHLATRPGKEVILSRLVELGADLSIKNEKNETPLEFSLAKMFTLAANYLFDKSPHSEKTLHMAISARNFNLMSKLIREGIFVSSSMIEKVANIDNNKNIQIEKILKTMFRYNANFNEVNWANIHNPIRVEFIQALLQKKQIKDEKKQLNSAINTNHHSLKKTSKIKL